VKFLTPQLTYLLQQQQTRQNLQSLLKYLAFLAGTVAVYSVLFQLLMLYEGQRHTWITGFYWTLTVMSTLGFGDITFHSDLGRMFSILVLLSGIVLLLIVLPFAFVRFFYAPWLEAQLRMRAPREAPASVRDHVILCRYDDIARDLIERLDQQGTPYFVIEPDAGQAAALHAEGVSVVTADLDSRATYENLRAEHARLVVANLDDATNTNVTLTIREVSPSVPIAALVEDKDAVDVLQLSGASATLPLKHRLGQHLASRVMVGTHEAHEVGRFKELVIAELPVHDTPLAGKTVAETRLRQLTGLSIVAHSERGRLHPARADTLLAESSVAVVVGSEEQVESLDAMLVIYEPNENPVVVMGGGKVGRAAIRALKQRDVVVHVVERDPGLRELLSQIADQVFIGDASDREIVDKAGLVDAPSVVLTTNDDATNVFLAIYCRRLNPHTRIVSRISSERNLEAVHRAGADFVLSYGALAVTSLLSLLQGRDPVLAGEGVDLVVEPVPESLAGKTLAESEIGARTGLNVIAVQTPDGPAVNPTPDTMLTEGNELVMLGGAEQHSDFRKTFA
jgi:Trk K+ transport system NAD-binding subunit